MQLKKENIPFTMVANEVLKDKNISFKAKGLYAYLFSKPDDWDFSSNRMILETTDGRKAIMGMLKELERAGYLNRSKLPNGRMEYTLKYSNKSLSPEMELRVEKPKSRNGTVPFGHSAESSPISNTDNPTNTDKKVIHNSDVPSQEIVSIIDSFKEVNQSAGKWYGNTTQRDAIKRLITTHSLERVLKVIKLLKQTNLIPYMPSIATPVQLEDKWSQLETALIRKKNEIQIKNDKNKVAFT
jgi:DNA-binding MarR family transcriptional regulator